MTHESGTAASHESVHDGYVCSTNTAIPVSSLIEPETPSLDPTEIHHCQRCDRAVRSSSEEVVRLDEALEERKKKALATNAVSPLQIRDEWFCQPCKVWKWAHPPQKCLAGNHMLAHHTACRGIWRETKAEGIHDIEPYMFLNWLYERPIKRLTRDTDLQRYRLYCLDVEDFEPKKRVVDPGDGVESPSSHQDLVL